ncbi:hypothetical protein GTH32_18010 [Alteromonas sp. 345S023]|uniref:Uncharacterized protein n=1 Tax=Alteromonas profundi TaxID=2696062 RepID=A0A7X5LPC3_9ALTE|nr:hypothetical protein [Alteromonas profundi]NDV93066.1 hypothetical protein [Alteromonas profundi]
MNDSPFAQFTDTFPSESRDSNMNFLINNYHILTLFTEHDEHLDLTGEEKLVGGPDQFLVMLRLATEHDFRPQIAAPPNMIYLTKTSGDTKIKLEVTCSFNVRNALSKMQSAAEYKLQEW